MRDPVQEAVDVAALIEERRLVRERERSPRWPGAWAGLAALIVFTSVAGAQIIVDVVGPIFNNPATLAPAVVNACGVIGGIGPCDAGFPVTSFQGYARGTFGWGPECGGMIPSPTVPGFDNTSAARYAHTGNVTYDGGMYFDTSLTCCRRSGDCVELWGDDPATGNNIGETPVSSNNAADGTGYGFLIEGFNVTNLLHDTRDLSTGWTATGITVSQKALPGPFGYFLHGPGGLEMAQFTVVNDGGVQQICQTVDAGSAGQFTFSCFLHAGTIGAARLSLTGTGNSAGNRTLTIPAMSDAGQGRREGVISLYPGYTGLTALTACISAGAANNVSGTFGVSDCQLELDPFGGFGHVSMYTPNIGPVGTTVNRSNGTFGVSHPDSFDAGFGCVGMARSERVYDPGAIQGTWNVDYGTWLSTGGANTAKALFTDGTAATMSFDGTHTLLSSNPGIGTEGDGGWWMMTVEWDGGTMSQWDGGSLLSSPMSAPLINDGDRLQLGTNHGVGNNSMSGNYGPAWWGTGNSCRSNAPVINKNGHKIYVMGDGWSGGGTGHDDPSEPRWFDYVQNVVTTRGVGVALTNRWLWNGIQGTGFADKKVKFGSGTYDSEAVWLGGGDIGLDGGFDPTALFGDVRYYAQREARKGFNFYLFNLAPVGQLDDGGNIQTKAKVFNQRFRDWCADGGYPGYSSYGTPEPNLKCIDVNLLLDPDQDGIGVPAYINSAGSGYLTDAGAQAVGNLFLQSWP